MLAPTTARSAPPTTAPSPALPREVQPHLAEFERFFSGQVETFEPHLRELVRYVFANQGKRIRPSLVFCSGWTDNGRIVPDQVYAAAVVELIHLATLVHDDVLDGAALRHQLPTVSDKFGASVAVLLGDALLTQALKIASDSLSIEVCRAMAAATRRVCAGEIHQTLERGNPRFSVNEYFEVIAMKTGELFGVSCLLGARVAGHPEEFVDAATRFGLQLGIAYQLFDDLADFCGDEGKIGKTLGTDLASGKFTLPFYCSSSACPKAKPPPCAARYWRAEPMSKTSPNVCTSTASSKPCATASKPSCAPARKPSPNGTACPPAPASLASPPTSAPRSRGCWIEFCLIILIHRKGAKSAKKKFCSPRYEEPGVILLIP